MAIKQEEDLREQIRDLQQQLAEARELLSNVSQGVLAVDPEGVVHFANDSFAKMVETPVERLVGARLEGLIAERSAVTPSAILSGVPSDAVEILFTKSDQTNIAARASVRPYTSPAGDRVIVLTTPADLLRSESQDRSRQSDTRFRRLFDAGMVGISCGDWSTIYEANDVFLNMVGYTREDLEARRLSWRELTPPEYLPVNEKAIEETLAKGHCKPFEKEYVRKDGSRVPVLLGLTLITRSPFEAVGFILDLTERKQLERRILEAEKWQSIGVLAGGIAHDFNNLLTRVMANASLAQGMLPTDHPVTKLLDSIIGASDRAANLVNEILAYSGKGQFFLEKVNVLDLQQDISKMLEAPVFEKIDVRLALAPSVPAIEGDRRQIKQLIRNLLLNAAEAIGGQPGVISVSIGVQSLGQDYIHQHLPGAGLPAGRYVYLRVQDSGCGMDDTTRSRVFDPFFTTKFLGRGLGLAAAAGIVRGHKGGIELTTAAGKGSTFTVWLPAASASHASR